MRPACFERGISTYTRRSWNASPVRHRDDDLQGNHFRPVVPCFERHRSAGYGKRGLMAWKNRNHRRYEYVISSLLIPRHVTSSCERCSPVIVIETHSLSTLDANSRLCKSSCCYHIIFTLQISSRSVKSELWKFPRSFFSLSEVASEVISDARYMRVEHCWQTMGLRWYCQE